LKVTKSEEEKAEPVGSLKQLLKVSFREAEDSYDFEGELERR